MKKILTLISLTGSLVFAQTSQYTTLIGQWSDPALPNNGPGIDYQVYQEVWGYAQDNREYAIIGSTMGMHFIDITDTANITEVDRVLGKAAGPGVIHRDFKNFGHYLYAVCDEGPSSLQVIDMQYLPDSVHVVYDSDSLTIRAHNLFVDTSMAKLYLFGANSGFITPGGMVVGFRSMVLSLANPELPTFLGTFDQPGFGYIHDGYAYNDTVLFNCGTSGFFYGYWDSPNPHVELGSRTSYEDQGYNHSGWLTPDKKHYVMSDETHGMQMKILDMEQGVNLLSTCGLIGSGINNYSIPHNQLIKGDYLYVSYYYDGLRIYDMTDPCNLVQAGYYDTYPGDAVDGGYSGAWGTYPLLPSGKILVGDMQTGLYIVKFEQNQYLGVEEETTSLSLYPNPTSDLVNLNDTYENIRIMDVNGKLVKTFKNTAVISVQELPTGIYVLGVEKEGKWSFQKLAKD